MLRGIEERGKVGLNLLKIEYLSVSNIDDPLAMSLLKQRHIIIYNEHVFYFAFPLSTALCQSTSSYEQGLMSASNAWNSLSASTRIELAA